MLILDDLLPELKKRAAWLAAANPEADEEDVCNDMILAIMEKAADDPEFMNQKPAFVLQFATWYAKNQANRARIYQARLETEGDQDENRETILETIEDLTSANPEQAVIIRQTLRELQEEVIAKFTGNKQAIIRLMAQGYSRVEISNELNISKAAVTQACKRIGLILEKKEIQSNI